MDTSRALVGSSATMNFAPTESTRGHADPPFFAARELVREVGELALFEAYLLEQIAYTPVHLGTANLMMDGDRFGENIADTHLGIERRVQVLEDHLHLAPELP